MEIDDKLDHLAGLYDQNWSEYSRYMSLLDWDTKELWQPVIYGCMLGQSLAPFMGKFNWNETTTKIVYDDNGNEIDRFEVDGKYIEPPCGDMPDSVMLVCFHAKRLDPEIIDSLLPSGRKEALQAYHDHKRKLLYGSDALSVIELFEIDFA